MRDVCTTSETAVFVVGSTEPVTLAVPNADRNHLIIHNESGTLFVKLAKYASQSSFSHKLTSGSTLELGAYQGFVSGIKQTGETAVLVTEML